MMAEMEPVDASVRNGFLQGVLAEASASQSMMLAAAELRRAEDIKEAVESTAHLQNLTDFDYVQYSLTTSGESMEMVLHRVYMMQCFRETHHVEDTVEEGVALFRRMCQQQPGAHLAVEYLPDSGNFVAISDIAAFHPSKVTQLDEGWRTCVCGLYYKFQAMCVDFQSIREGMSVVSECMGASVSNFDPAFNERLMLELYQHYPKKHKELMFLNAPSVICMMFGLWKKFFNQNMKETLKLGCNVRGMEGERIDFLYKMPTLEIAQEYMIQKVHTFLWQREINRKSFSLSPSPR